MSVERYKTADGIQWRVRWREHDGRKRSRTAVNKREALAIDAEIKTRKYKGEMLPRPGRATLAAAYDDWWRLRGATLASTTQRTYRAVWNAHVKDRFDHHPLGELAANPQLFEELIADMRTRGVGNAAQRKTLVVVSAVLTAAVEWKQIATNPLWRLRKPPGTRLRHPRPFPPVVIERIRLQMLRRETKDKNRGAIRSKADAAFLGLMSYAGLRPGEALALTWGDIGQRTIAVDKAVSDGEERQTKTGAVRGVPLLEALADDLRAFRWSSGAPDEHALVLPAHDGGYWSRAEFNNWRNRVWKPIMTRLAAGEPALHRLAEARPYDCRGSFISLHLRAGASPLEVAQWAGHSPAVMFRHYANVIEELVGEPRLSADEQINRARDVVLKRPKRELDRLVADLLERPTVASEGEARAATIFFQPN